MNSTLPLVYLARHGETAWSRSGQHTGLSNLPLTEHGEQSARELKERISGVMFEKVITSPLQRAMRTCELAGFGAKAERDQDLVEWNYGKYEGRSTAFIHICRPDWDLFRDGCPGGERLGDVAERADRVIKRIRVNRGNTLVFSSGHFLRVFAARWLNLDPMVGKYLTLDTASLSILGYEHELSRPVIQLWNETGYLSTFSPNQIITTDLNKRDRLKSDLVSFSS